MTDRNNHIVYVARYNGKVMYVGEGRPERYKHITSGVSQCYEANKHHFEGKPLKVDIVERGLTKEQGRKRERELIDELMPEWNKPAFGLRGLNKAVIGAVWKDAGYQLSRGHSSRLRIRSLVKFLLYKMDSEGKVEMKISTVLEGTGGDCDGKFIVKLPPGPHKQSGALDEYVTVAKGKRSGWYEFTLNPKWFEFSSNRNRKYRKSEDE